MRFRVPQPQTLGVPQPTAALLGVAIGLILLGYIIAFVSTLWVAAVLALVYGFIAQVPGALVVRLWRRMKEWLGG